MRLAFFSSDTLLVVGWSAALAQQSPYSTTDKPVGDAIGHPPPLPGSAADSRTAGEVPPQTPPTPPTPAAAAPQASEPAPKGKL